MSISTIRPNPVRGGAFFIPNLYIFVLLRTGTILKLAINRSIIDVSYEIISKIGTNVQCSLLWSLRSLLTQGAFYLSSLNLIKS